VEQRQTEVTKEKTFMGGEIGTWGTIRLKGVFH